MQHPEQERLGGTIEKVLYHSEETGFCVLFIKVEGQQGPASVVGATPSVKVGDSIECVGSWHTHRKYGLQFKAMQLTVVPPTTKEGIEKYLSSGMVSGIGPRLAKVLVQTFEEEVFQIISTSPERLLEVDGVGPKRQEKIVSAWQEHWAVHEIMMFLQSHGIGAAMAYRVYKTYGAQSISKITENPYRLSLEIRGIGFKSADQLARHFGVAPNSMMRARAGVRHVLQEFASKGNCAALLDQLIRQAENLLTIPWSVIEEAIEEEVAEGRFVKDIWKGQSCIYLSYLYKAEIGVSESILRLLDGSRPFWTGEAPARAISVAERETGVVLSESQRLAVAMALQEKVAIITGGPGVGKTTVLNTLLQVIKAIEPRILFCAPTGRASKRMSEATGMEAMTIHRCLEFSPHEFGFKRGRDHPLDVDLVVVDEASMLDISLTNALLQALPDHAALLMVGDIDQLPSVGPGNVLKDLIASGVIPTARLTEIFRQAHDSKIIVNAHRINNGETLEDTSAGEDSDFYFIQAETPDEIQHMLLKVVTERIPEAFGFDPVSDIQVLSPMHKGPLGTRSLNRELQKCLNPVSGPRVERLGSSFAAGDKVIQGVNNYDKGVFNGDLGRVVYVDLEQGEVGIDFDGQIVSYDMAELDEISLAYCTTIHKSQGSEYPVVVMPLSNQHYVMLERNLLYTGVTRGKKLVVLIGQDKALSTAIRRVKAQSRFAMLQERLEYLDFSSHRTHR